MPSHRRYQFIHLIASHCKPRPDSSNPERLNGDHLFDRGFISFEDYGTLIVSLVAHAPSLEGTGIETRRTVSVGGFTAGQKHFLEFDRNMVLLRASR